ncbi:MAG: ABC transporter ATP-binding protein [Ignavibacteriales bacterium]|nr:MAG: ABC transporter ATP-binding protein [Ignavibacteriales bacterium]
MSEYLLELQNISKSLTDERGVLIHLLENIPLNIEKQDNDGAIYSIIAPRCSGKTTLLKIISGVENQTSGIKKFDGKEYTSADGSIIYISQNSLSFPWLNVKDNICFPVLEKNKSVNENHISKIINDVGLAGYNNHFPDEKSFGFRFRIALARALTTNPKIILLDDTFNSMKYETKTEIYSLLKIICKNYHTVFILTTSDPIEALILSKTVFLMSKFKGTIFDKIEIELGNSAYISPLNDKSFIDLLNRVELKLRKQNSDDFTTISL